MEWLADPHLWASFITLSALEIVLGVDNLVFIALLAGRLPPEQRDLGRRLGLGLALGTRLALLGSIAWISHLTEPVISLAGRDLSWRDLILLGGGIFLVFKGTREIHLRVDGDEGTGDADGQQAGLTGTVVQIVLLDIIFSLDSVITAVGIADNIWVMVAAIVVAMIIMLVASNGLATFIERHSSLKMLALAFLLLIGTTLIADGLGFHFPRGYVFAAMGFSVLVESLNLLVAQRRQTKRGRIGQNVRPRVEPAVKSQ
jgi:predicted tellurium resistance membrane protein TerC